MLLSRSPSSNIFLATAARFLSIGCAAISVPLLINKLGNAGYGTWAAISSLISATSILDLGFGNSIRNSVAELDIGQTSFVKQEYIGFFQVLQVLGGVLAVSLIFWSINYPFPVDQKLSILFLYLPLLLCLPLFLSNNVLQGARLYGLQSLIQIAPTCSILLYLIFAFYCNSVPGLLGVAAAYSCTNIVCLIITFALGLKVLKLTPRVFLWLKISAIPRARLSKSIQFLFLQVASLVLTGLGNIIIYSFLGSLEATRYDVVNKPFQVAFSFYAIQIGVMWAEISIAKSERNIQRLRMIFKRLVLTSALFSSCCFVLAFLAPVFVSKWTGDKVHVTLLESSLLAVLASVQSLSYAGAVFMNAFEQITPQIIIAIFSSFAMLPLSLFFFSLNMGLVSVPLSSIILLSLAAIICIIYSSRILSRQL